MYTQQSYLDVEDDEGISKLKKFGCDLGGVNGVRKVKQLFIQIRNIHKLYTVN